MTTTFSISDTPSQGSTILGYAWLRLLVYPYDVDSEVYNSPRNKNITMPNENDWGQQDVCIMMWLGGSPVSLSSNPVNTPPLSNMKSSLHCEVFDDIMGEGDFDIGS